MRNAGGARCVEGETTKMQHFQMIQFQLFISLNISSLYIFLTVRILIAFLFPPSKMLDPQRPLWKKQTNTHLGHGAIFSFISPMLENRQSLRHRKSSG